jgi:hypothetical protein
MSAEVSSCDVGNSSSMSSTLTPLDSKKVTFFSRGASRIAGSSRNLAACSSNGALSGCESEDVASSAPGAGVGAGSVTGCCSGMGSCSEGLAGDGGEAVRCHEGISFLSDMSFDPS